MKRVQGDATIKEYAKLAKTNDEVVIVVLNAGKGIRAIIDRDELRDKNTRASTLGIMLKSLDSLEER